MNKNHHVYMIYAFSTILAACSLLYELLIAQAVSYLVNNNVVWYSLTIGFYLAAMGFGAFWYHKFHGQRRVWEALFQIEVLLTIIGCLSVMFIHFGHMLFSFLWAKSQYLAAAQQINLQLVAQGLFFSLFFLIVIAVGVLTGLELPLLIGIGKETFPEQKITNRILGADYFGSLLAGFSFPLLLLPYFELVTISFMTAMVNLSVAGYILFRYKAQVRRFVYKMGSTGIVFCLLLTGVARIDSLQQFFLKKYYYYLSLRKATDLLRPMTDFPEIERYSTPYHKIDIVRRVSYHNPITPKLVRLYSSKFRDDPQYPQKHILFLNGDFQFNTDIEEFYHEYFAHIPVIFNGQVPKKVLVLGGGDGLLVRELVKYPKIESITLIDLDEKMVELARTHPVLSYMEKGALADSRVEIQFADAFHYIKESRETYDAIYMDFPDATEYNLSKLYSREFYRFVYDHLTEAGYAVFDTSDLSRKIDLNTAFSVYYNTLKAAGFGKIIPYGVNIETHDRGIKENVELLIKDMVRQGKEREYIEAYQYFLNNRGMDYIVEKTLEIFKTELQQGFVMVKKGHQDVHGAYKNPGIKLYVLNEHRFKLAFSMTYPYPKATDPLKINSVMRPTLPRSVYLNHIKLPY